MRKIIYGICLTGLLNSPCFSQGLSSVAHQVWRGGSRSPVEQSFRYVPLEFFIQTPIRYNPQLFESVWVNPPASFTWKIPPLVSVPSLYQKIKEQMLERERLQKGFWRLLSKVQTDAVIFDLDGTLLDSLPAWEHSGSNYVRSRGFEPEVGLDERLEKMSLTDGAKLIKEMYQLNESPEEILAATLAPIKARYYTDIPAKSNVPTLLAFLRAQGTRMVVATASDADLAAAALKRLGLLEYFEFIITCDEVGIGKTSPRVYEEALARLGVSKDRVVVAEDALYALKTAHQAGFKTIGVAEKKAAAQEAQARQFSTLFLSFE